MNFTPPENAIAALSWRYATKQFDPSRKIAPDAWKAIENAAVLAPSSYGLQPWKFIVVNDPDVRTQLRAASWNQPQITDASHLLVLCRRTTMDAAYVQKYAELISQVRGVPVSQFQPFVDMMLATVNNFPKDFDVAAWNARQVYIALGFVLAAAATMGIDACPMEGLQPKQYDHILGLEGTDYAACVVAAFGYRASNDATASFKKVRFPLQSILTHV